MCELREAATEPISDWSLITRTGGGGVLQNGREGGGGACEVLPL